MKKLLDTKAFNTIAEMKKAGKGYTEIAAWANSEGYQSERGPLKGPQVSKFMCVNGFRVNKKYVKGKRKAMQLELEEGSLSSSGIIEHVIASNLPKDIKIKIMERWL